MSGLLFRGLYILLTFVFPLRFMFYPVLAWRLGTACVRAYLDLVRRPCVHTQRFDFRDMGAHLSVQRSASHTDEGSQTPARPSRVERTTVGAFVIAWYAKQLVQVSFVSRLLSLAHGRHGGDEEAIVCVRRLLWEKEEARH